MKEQIFIISYHRPNLPTPPMFYGLLTATASALHWNHSLNYNVLKKPMVEYGNKNAFIQELKFFTYFQLKDLFLARLLLQYFHHILFIISSTARDCILTTFTNSLSLLQFVSKIPDSFFYFSPFYSFNKCNCFY